MERGGKDDESDMLDSIMKSSLKHVQRIAKTVQESGTMTYSIMDSQEIPVANAFMGEKHELSGKTIVFYLFIFSFLCMHKSNDKKHVSKV